VWIDYWIRNALVDRNLHAVDLVNLYPKITRNVKLQAVIILRKTHKNKVTSCCSSSHNSTGRRSICQQYRHLLLFCTIKQKKNCGIPHLPPVSNARVSSTLECNYTDFETAGIIFVTDQLQAWLERTYLLGVCVCLCVYVWGGGRTLICLSCLNCSRFWDLPTSSRTLRCVTFIKDVVLLQRLGKRVVFHGLKTLKILH